VVTPFASNTWRPVMSWWSVPPGAITAVSTGVLGSTVPELGESGAREGVGAVEGVAGVSAGVAGVSAGVTAGVAGVTAGVAGVTAGVAGAAAAATVMVIWAEAGRVVERPALLVTVRLTA
jgi:hypothetical protein